MSEDIVDKVLPNRVERYTSASDPAEPTQIVTESPDRANVPEGAGAESGGLVEPVAPQAPVLEFFLNGKVGQFFLLRDHWILEPEHSRAILDTIWPIQVREIPESENGPAVLHFVAFSPLFRKIENGAHIPPYALTTGNGEQGIEVYAEEQPMPERPKIAVPRKDRREMERFAARQRKLETLQP